MNEFALISLVLCRINYKDGTLGDFYHKNLKIVPETIKRLKAGKTKEEIIQEYSLPNTLTEHDRNAILGRS